jgi:hypothetical protein
MGIECAAPVSQEDLFYMTGSYAEPIPPMPPEELSQKVNHALLQTRGHVVGAFDALDGYASLLEEDRAVLAAKTINRHHRLLLVGARLADVGTQLTQLGRDPGHRDKAQQLASDMMLDNFSPLIQALHRDRALVRHPSQALIAGRVGCGETKVSKIFSGITVSEDGALGVAQFLLERQQRGGRITADDVTQSMARYEELIAEHTRLVEEFPEKLRQYEVWDDLPSQAKDIGQLAPEVSIVNRIVRSGLGTVRSHMRRTEYIEDRFIAAAIKRRIRVMQDYHNLARLAFDIYGGDQAAIEAAINPKFRIHNFIRDTAWKAHMSGVPHAAIAEAAGVSDEASVSKVLRGIEPMEPDFARGVIYLLANRKKISSVGREAFAGKLLGKYQEYRADINSKQRSEPDDE